MCTRSRRRKLIHGKSSGSKSKQISNAVARFTKKTQWRKLSSTEWGWGRRKSRGPHREYILILKQRNNSNLVLGNGYNYYQDGNRWIVCYFISFNIILALFITHYLKQQTRVHGVHNHQANSKQRHAISYQMEGKATQQKHLGIWIKDS